MTALQDHMYEMWMSHADNDFGWVCFECDGVHHGGFPSLSAAEIEAKLAHEVEL